MIIVSNLINQFFLVKLKSKAYRNEIFHAALKNELRNHKIGKVILRNLNNLMNSNSMIHNEFVSIVGEENFQIKFWESDLGFLWFDGNTNVNKPYFNETINSINTNQLKSLLDVGCGWGVFCNLCVHETQLLKIKGIDISEGVIINAKNKFSDSKLNFEVKNLLDINDKFDIVTIFGSIDYVSPNNIEEFVLKMIEIANKKIVIVNSLRKIDLTDALLLQASVEVKRYDVGYVHPFNYILQKYQDKLNYTFSIEKSGLDSTLIFISK